MNNKLEEKEIEEIELEKRKIQIEEKIKEEILDLYLKTYQEGRFYITKNELFESRADFIEKANISNVLDSGIATKDLKNETVDLVTVDEIDSENMWKNTYDTYLNAYVSRKIQIDLEKKEIKKQNSETLPLCKIYYDNNIFNDIEKEISKLEENEKQIEMNKLRKIQNNKLLLFCIKNQYIDEYYQLYISNITLDNVNIIEYNFILDIKTGKNKNNYYTKLQNLEIINSKLNDNDFNDINILNIYLLDFLLINEKIKIRSKKMIENIVELMKNQEYELFDYLMLNLENKIEFINELILINSGIWDLIIKNNKYTKQTLIEYMTIILENAKTNRVIDILKNDNVIKCINMIKKLDVKCLEKMLDCEIKFKDINEFDKDALKLIIEFYMYEINNNNVNCIIEKVLLIKNIKDINKKGFSILKNNQNVYQYILNNIKEYIENIYLTNTIQQENDEADVILLLNDKKLDFETKNKIIEKESAGNNVSGRFLLENLEDILDTKLYSNIIKEELIKISYKNINVFYENGIKNETDKDIKIENKNILINFINNNFRKIQSGDKIEKDSGILSFLLFENKLNIMSYKKVLNDSQNKINGDITKLDLNKQEYIINKKRLEFSLDNFEKIKNQKERNLTIRFIEKYNNFIIENIEKIVIDSYEFVWIFESNLSEKIKNVFLQDIVNYNYDNFSFKDMDIIAQCIVDTDIEIKFTKEKIMEMIDITERTDLKIKLTNKYINLFDSKDLMDVLNRYLPPKYKNIMEKNRQPEFEKTDEIIVFIDNINKICGFDIRYSEVKNRKIKIKKHKVSKK